MWNAWGANTVHKNEHNFWKMELMRQWDCFNEDKVCSKCHCSNVFIVNYNVPFRKHCLDRKERGDTVTRWALPAQRETSCWMVWVSLSRCVLWPGTEIPQEVFAAKQSRKHIVLNSWGNVSAPSLYLCVCIYIHLHFQCADTFTRPWKGLTLPCTLELGFPTSAMLPAPLACLYYYFLV